MAITPNNLDFNYKKNTTLPPARVVNYSANSNTINESFISFEVSDNWISVTNITDTSSQISINANAENLAEGSHAATVEFFFNEEEILGFDQGNPPSFVKTSLGSVAISLIITETVVLKLNPENLTFNYNFGGVNPNPQSISIISENSWTVTESTSWLSVSTNAGANNGSFQVTVVPTGLNAGTHTAIITVDDGISSIQLPVALVVSEVDTQADYLYITPNILNFGYTISGYIPPSKRIELNSSGNWTVVANQSWVNLLVNSGSSGSGYLDIGIHNLSGLSKGKYYATVSIINGVIVKTINITLCIYEFAQELLSTDTLYFSDDNNRIKLSSGRVDTHLEINASTIFEGRDYTIKYNAPFFKGVGRKRIGFEAKRIIGDRNFIGIGSSSLFSPYKPLRLNLEINEVETFTDINTQSINLDNISFVKGKRPPGNWLSENAKTQYVTKKGIVLFSFLSNGLVANKIKISGAVNDTLEFSNSLESFYTAMIRIESFNVKVGDELQFSVNNNIVNVIIIPESKEQSFVFWENQWGLWDVIEFTGEFNSISNLKETSFEYRSDYETTVKKVLDVRDLVSYKIDTGWMYSQEAVASLSNMLKSKNMYIYKGFKLTKIKSTTKKLPFYKTRDTLKSFSLTFENVLR